jgi:hypothetical protein
MNNNIFIRNHKLALTKTVHEYPGESKMNL